MVALKNACSGSKSVVGSWGCVNTCGRAVKLLTVVTFCVSSNNVARRKLSYVKKMTGARSWTGPTLAWPLWPRSSEGQGQGHYICGPDMEGQGQVRQKSPGPGPDRPSDSLVSGYPCIIIHQRISSESAKKTKIWVSRHCEKSSIII